VVDTSDEIDFEVDCVKLSELVLDIDFSAVCEVLNEIDSGAVGLSDIEALTEAVFEPRDVVMDST
jgi:hypothetical protein